MTPDNLITIVVAIVAALGSGLGVALLNRRKTAAEINSMVVRMVADAANDAVGLYNQEIKLLQSRLDIQEAELEAQARTLEDLNTSVLRWQLVTTILISQLRIHQIEPVIDEAMANDLSVDELRDIARGMRRKKS